MLFHRFTKPPGNLDCDGKETEAKRNTDKSDERERVAEGS